MWRVLRPFEDTLPGRLRTTNCVHVRVRDMWRLPRSMVRSRQHVFALLAESSAAEKSGTRRRQPTLNVVRPFTSQLGMKVLVEHGSEFTRIQRMANIFGEPGQKNAKRE